MEDFNKNLFKLDDADSVVVIEFDCNEDSTTFVGFNTVKTSDSPNELLENDKAYKDNKEV